MSRCLSDFGTDFETRGLALVTCTNGTIATHSVSFISDVSHARSCALPFSDDLNENKSGSF